MKQTINKQKPARKLSKRTLAKKIREQHRQEMMEELGIESGKRRENSTFCYIISKEEVAKLDHTKYPRSNRVLIEDRRYMTYKQADEVARELGLKDPGWMYLPYGICIFKSEYKKLCQDWKTELGTRKYNTYMKLKPSRTKEEIEKDMEAYRKKMGIAPKQTKVIKQPPKPQKTPPPVQDPYEAMTPRERGIEKLRLKALIRSAESKGENTDELKRQLHKIESI